MTTSKTAQNTACCGNRNYWGFLFFFCCLSFFIAVFSLPPTLQANTVEHYQIERQYNLAKDYYFTLERDPSLGKSRQKWLGGIRNFRKIYLLDPDSPKAPSSLYMIARMHYRMFKKFSVPIDLDEAITYYNDVASLFPRDSLADDALFNTAEIFLNDKKDPIRAGELFRQLTEIHAGGDQYAKAVNRLHQLDKKHNIDLPENLHKETITKHLVGISPAKHWSSDEYTRIVVQAEAPVHFSDSLLEKHGNQPRRLYIDFAQSQIAPENQAPIPIGDGLLQQIRVGQFDSTTVRVVLDIESISNYKIFALKDPFRVVVDVHGEKKVRPPATTPVKPEAEPEPEENVAADNEKPNLSNQEPEKTVTATAVKIIKSQPFISLQDFKKVKPDDTTSSARAITKPVRAEKNMNISLAQQLGLGVRRIVIDPGHGGKDPGAMGFGLKEKDIVLEVGKKLAEKLRENNQYETLLTRNKDVFLPLEERIAIANTKKADLFISLHINAHPQKKARGIETFYLNLATNAEAMRVAALENATSTHNISDLQTILSDLMQNSKIQESALLAEFVQTNIISGLKDDLQYAVKDLGVKQAPFYVLLGAEMPAVLVEISFITNPEEAKLLGQDTYLDAIADQIADGISQYATHYAKADPSVSM